MISSHFRASIAVKVSLPSVSVSFNSLFPESAGAKEQQEPDVSTTKMAGAIKKNQRY